CRHLQHVARQRDQPIGTRSGGEPSRSQAEQIAEQLARARDDPDGRPCSSKQREIRPGDAAHAFIGHVGEQADDAERDDEGEGGFFVEALDHGLEWQAMAKHYKKPAAAKAQDALAELWPGQSVELLKALHILTRDGALNADSRRKLK